MGLQSAEESNKIRHFMIKLFEVSYLRGVSLKQNKESWGPSGKGQDHDAGRTKLEGLQ